jgi:hypothetical protein
MYLMTLQELREQHYTAGAFHTGSAHRGSAAPGVCALRLIRVNLGSSIAYTEVTAGMAPSPLRFAKGAQGPWYIA